MTAVVALAFCALTWLASFLPGQPMAPFAGGLTALAFPLALLPFFVVAASLALANRSGAATAARRSVDIRGWRRGGLLVLVLIAVAGAVLNRGPGGTYEENGRYWSRSKGSGKVTEISRDQWAAAEVAEARMAAGFLIVFAGVAAVRLTQEWPPAGPAGPTTSVSRARQQLGDWPPPD